MNEAGQMIYETAKEIKEKAVAKAVEVKDSVSQAIKSVAVEVNNIKIDIGDGIKASIKKVEEMDIVGSLSNKLKGYCDNVVETIGAGISVGVDYVGKSLNQLILGEYTDDVTLLGTALQMGVAFFGIDLPMYIRDLYHNFTNWEWSWEHVGTTALNLVAIVPGIGMIKSVDELALLAKSADKVDGIVDVVKKTDDIIVDIGQDIVNKSNEVVDVVGDASSKGKPVRRCD